MSWLWALAGYSLGDSVGREEGREEGIQEAKRRIDGDPGDGRPRIHRKQGGPPPAPPTRGQWIAAVILGALIFGVAWMIDGAIFQDGGNYTADDYPSNDGLMSFANAMMGLFRVALFLMSFAPLANTASQWFASQDQDTPGRFKFREEGDSP